MRVGREVQREAVREWVRGSATAGGGRLIVEGEPGSGRTRLVREALAEAAARGLAVRYGAAEALATDLPLRAVLDCLYPEEPGDIGDTGATGDPRGGGAPGGREAVVRLLREAGGANGPAGRCSRRWTCWWRRSSGGAAGARCCWCWTTCTGRTRPASSCGGAWAGRWRRAWLRLLLAATRQPLPKRPEVELLCAELGADLVRLGPLSAVEAAGLLRELLGAPPGPRLREAAERAGGNPRLLRDLARQWSGVIRVAAGVAELRPGRGDLPPPPASVSRGLDYLSRAALACLRHAALLGPRFTPRELALVQGRPVRELLGELEEPVLAGLLEDTGEGLRFRHPALRQALYLDTPAAVRAALHQDAARAFAAAGLDPARTAEQLLAGGVPDAWAVRWLADSAGSLLQVAPDAAAELLERALARGPREDPAALDALEENLADAALLLRRPEAVELLDALRERAVDPGRRAALAFKLVSALMIQGDMERCLAVTEAALAEPFPSAAYRLRLEACRVLALADLRRPREAYALAASVVAEAARLGDPLCGAEAQHAMSFTLFHLNRGRESLRHVAEGIAYARRSAEANDMRLLLLANQAEGHVRFDEPEAARAALREARQLAVRTRSTGRLVVTEALLAEFHYRLGEWDAALEGVARADGLPVSDGWLPVVVRGLRALVLGHRDERERVARSWRRCPRTRSPRRRPAGTPPTCCWPGRCSPSGTGARRTPWRRCCPRWWRGTPRTPCTTGRGCCRSWSASPWSAGTRRRPGRRCRRASGRRRSCPSTRGRSWPCCAAGGCSRRTRSCWRGRWRGPGGVGGRWCGATRWRTSRWRGPGTGTSRVRGRP